jgi:CheY-like chemotaxis protein
MHGQSRYILCVDDDIDDYTLVFEAIKTIDPSMYIVEAHDGEEALNYLNKAKTFNILPCLVILDINMPRMDGKQTLVHIKEDTDLKNIPVVILSTSDTQRDRLFCSYYGVDLYTKPNKTAEYKLVIDQLLKYCDSGVRDPG